MDGVNVIYHLHFKDIWLSLYPINDYSLKFELFPIIFYPYRSKAIFSSPNDSVNTQCTLHTFPPTLRTVRLREGIGQTYRKDISICSWIINLWVPNFFLVQNVDVCKASQRTENLGSVYFKHRIIDDRMEKYGSVFVFISK